VIGTVASLRPEKDLARLIDLFAGRERAIRNTDETRILGDGAKRGGRRKRNADRILFAGATSTSKDFLADGYFRAGFYTANKCPQCAGGNGVGSRVLSFNVGDLPRMVARENVAIVSISLTDGDSYLECLLRLIDDPGLRVHIGAANRKAAGPGSTSRRWRRLMANCSVDGGRGFVGTRQAARGWWAPN
jgi:hypothetical protein